MTYKEIFTFGKKLETTADKIRFYGVFVAVGIVLGVAYGVAPFFYSKEYLVEQTKKDLAAFVQGSKPVEDTRFSFMKRVVYPDGCQIVTARAKFVPYVISKASCGGEK